MAGLTPEEKALAGITVSPDNEQAPMTVEERALALGIPQEQPVDPQMGQTGQGFGSRPQGRLTPEGIFNTLTGETSFQESVQPPFEPSTAIGNIPGSLSDVVVSGVESVTSPLQTIGLIKSGVKGAVDIAQGEETEDAAIAKELSKQLTRMLRDPAGTLQEDPVGGILDLSAVTKPAMLARMGNVGKAAKFLKYVDPAEIAVTAVSKGGKKGLSLLSDFMESKAGLRSGVGALRVSAAREAGKAGGGQAQAFRETLKSNKDMSDLVLDYERGIQAGKSTMAERFREDTARLKFKDSDNPVNPVDVRKEIAKDLEDTWGIKIDRRVNSDGTQTIELDFGKTRWAGDTGPARAKQERIRQAFALMKDWGDASIDGSHLAIQQLDEIVERGPNSSNYAGVNAVVQGMRQKIRDELGNKIDGYNFRAERYAQMKQFLEETEKALGITPQRGPLDFIGIEGNIKPINTKTLTRIGNAMNERLSDSNAYNRALVEEIDNIIEVSQLKQAGYDLAAMPKEKLLEMAIDRGIPSEGRKLADVQGDLKTALIEETGSASNLSTELAAIQLRDLVPQGIARAMATSGAGGFGTGAAVGAGLAHAAGFGDVGALVGASAGSAVGRMLSSVTIDNPRAVGNFFYRLGATEKLAGDMVKQLDNLRDNLTTKHKVTNAALSTMSVAEAVNRALREESKKMKKRRGKGNPYISRIQR